MCLCVCATGACASVTDGNCNELSLCADRHDEHHETGKTAVANASPASRLCSLSSERGQIDSEHAREAGDS